jgi:dTDP-4-dehydrorhamnose reductase
VAFFELREYRCPDGHRDAWVKYMEEVIIPFQASKGMVIVGSWVSETEDDLYIWMRRFESEEERVKLYAAVYDTDTWKNDIAPKIPDMMDRSRIVVRRLEPNSFSMIR